jgi:hypothetical protein
VRPYLKKPSTKIKGGSGRIVQDVGPEFKAQYRKEKENSFFIVIIRKDVVGRRPPSSGPL